MLKAKRIAKVMLCICIAFSMFITANADEIYNNGTIQNSITPSSNSALLYLKGIEEKFYTKEYFEIMMTIPYLNYNNNNINVSEINYYLLPKAVNLIRFNDNNDIIYINENIEVINYNDTYIHFKWYRTSLTINQSGVYTLIYKFIDITPETTYNIINPNKFVIIIKDDNNTTPTKNLINNIYDTINININNINNIIKFVTDKPWIILLGISVSLISFLIYKSKSIIR